MSGINRITQRRKEVAETRSDNIWELRLADGDDVYTCFLASGDEDDSKLDDYYVHVVEGVSDSGSRIWTNYFCPKTLDEQSACPVCETGERASHRFGVWCFVYYIMHNTQKNDEWEAITTATGQTRFKETVNSIRVFTRGFGLHDTMWNQLVALYGEYGGLNTLVTKISRVGEGLQTVYTFTGTPHKPTLPEGTQKDIDALEPIRDHFVGRFPIDKFLMSNVPVSSGASDVFGGESSPPWEESTTEVVSAPPQTEDEIDALFKNEFGD